jgi:hypothetical protein
MIYKTRPSSLPGALATLMLAVWAVTYAACHAMASAG